MSLSIDDLKSIAFQIGVLGQLERKHGQLTEMKKNAEVGEAKLDEHLVANGLSRSRMVFSVLNQVAKTHGLELAQDEMTEEWSLSPIDKEES